LLQGLQRTAARQLLLGGAFAGAAQFVFHPARAQDVADLVAELPPVHRLGCESGRAQLVGPVDRGDVLLPGPHDYRQGCDTRSSASDPIFSSKEKPSSTGISMSTRATSNRVLLSSRNAASPFAAVSTWALGVDMWTEANSRRIGSSSTIRMETRSSRT